MWSLKDRLNVKDAKRKERTAILNANAATRQAGCTGSAEDLRAARVAERIMNQAIRNTDQAVQIADRNASR